MVNFPPHMLLALFKKHLAVAFAASFHVYLASIYYSINKENELICLQFCQTSSLFCSCFVSIS